MIMILAAACGDDGGSGASVDAAVAIDSGPTVDSMPPSPDGGGTVPLGNVLAVLAGEFQPIGPATTGGRALLVRTDEGTLVSLHANGLESSADYTAHVHEWPCSANAGGGHYKIDPTIDTTQEANEIWLTFSPGASDTAYNQWSNISHQARRDAISMVVHDSVGTKLMCADLTLSDADNTDVATGTVAPFAGAEAGDMSIAGTGSLSRNYATGEIIWSLVLSGLDPAEAYVAHVHTLPCGVNDAGGHYKHDPAEAGGAGEANELWLTGIVSDGAGDASVTDNYTDSELIPREDAASFVVHRVGGPKVACTNLPRAAYSDRVTAGDYVAISGSATGDATMTRKNDGDTTATLTMSGLDADTAYTSHVHRRPCSMSMGGGHYKIDWGAADNIESNEIWLNFMSDSAGAGSGSGTAENHVAYAQAQSIVVHAPGGDRIGCVDLN